MRAIKIPDGMLQAARSAVFRYVQALSRIMEFDDNHAAKVALEAALRYWSEHPMKLSEAAINEIIDELPPDRFLKDWGIVQLADAIQRRMFLAEPEVPEEIENLLWGDWQRKQGLPEHLNGWMTVETHNNQVLEAFKRGQKNPISS